MRLLLLAGITMYTTLEKISDFGQSKWVWEDSMLLFGPAFCSEIPVFELSHKGVNVQETSMDLFESMHAHIYLAWRWNSILVVRGISERRKVSLLTWEKHLEMSKKNSTVQILTDNYNPNVAKYILKVLSKGIALSKVYSYVLLCTCILLVVIRI